jgi:hypothetical protein
MRPHFMTRESAPRWGSVVVSAKVAGRWFRGACQVRDDKWDPGGGDREKAWVSWLRARERLVGRARCTGRRPHSGNTRNRATVNDGVGHLPLNGGGSECERGSGCPVDPGCRHRIPGIGPRGR